MEMLLLSSSIFTVVTTCTLGYLLINKFFPRSNKEIAITKAFKLEEYETVIALTENQEHTQRHSLNIYIFAAQARAFLERYDEALSWYEMALTRLELLNSDRIYVELEIGDIFEKKNNLDQAEIHYRTAINLEKTHEKANHLLGAVLYKNGKFEPCRKVLREVLKKNPALIDTRKVYAECMAALGQYTKAIRHYGLLERNGEIILSYQYANTLKQLKIWDKAYDVYNLLLFSDKIIIKEQIICDLVETCIAMKKYHEALGIIETYIETITNDQMSFNLKYDRASVFYLRGDKMRALQEYQSLYDEKPFYKDLSRIVDKEAHWLEYPYLFSYFTSNEAIFETLITRATPPGLTIIRRSLDYYIGLIDKKAYLFYRDMKELPDQLIKDAEMIIFQLASEIDTIETWALGGMSGRYSVTGNAHKNVIINGENFLRNIHQATNVMEYTESNMPNVFVGGFQDAPQIIPIIDEILNNPNSIDDDLLERALEK